MPNDFEAVSDVVSEAVSEAVNKLAMTETPEFVSESVPEFVPEFVPESVLEKTRYFLHVGCGSARPERLPACFREAGWTEIRLDIDPAVQPHILASITDMNMIADGWIDAVWSSHNLEHLNAYEVPLALNEFARVLKPEGFVLLNMPDLRAIARHILADNVGNPLYMSEVGAITPLDMLFGHQLSLQHGHHYMAHRTGFTATTLAKSLLEAGFAEVRVVEGSRWDLWAIASMSEFSENLLEALAAVAP